MDLRHFTARPARAALWAWLARAAPARSSCVISRPTRSRRSSEPAWDRVRNTSPHFAGVSSALDAKAARANRRFTASRSVTEAERFVRVKRRETPRRCAPRRTARNGAVAFPRVDVEIRDPVFYIPPSFRYAPIARRRFELRRSTFYSPPRSNLPRRRLASGSLRAQRRSRPLDSDPGGEENARLSVTS